MGDQDGGDLSGGRQKPVEDLRLAADVELGCRLVEQHQSGSPPDCAQRAGQCDPLPLPAREIGAPGVALGQRCIQFGQLVGAGISERRSYVIVGRSATGVHVLPEGQLEIERSPGRRR